MKSYVRLELKFIIHEDEDVLTSSADFTDSAVGDNGVWFPGSKGGTWQ